MRKTCNKLSAEKVKKYMTIYQCKLKKEIYYTKKETCKNCPIQLKLEF